MTDNDRLISFLQGNTPDDKGRYLKDIWAMDNDQLEMTPDYIQWIFPIDIQSKHNPTAPILDMSDISPFPEDVLSNMYTSLDRMIKFYIETDDWMLPKNHNHKRISRIIYSLTLFDMQDKAEQFYKTVHGRELYFCRKTVLGRSGFILFSKDYKKSWDIWHSYIAD